MKYSGKDTLHHDIAGKDFFASDNAKMLEYRRKWEENPKKLDPGDFPLHLDIEVTSLCNLRCPFCATTYSRNAIKNGFIKWVTVKKILDEAADNGLYACKFNFRGEPLLHKDLGKFIKYAKKKGIIDVFFNTNGTLLTERAAKMLIDSGLDRLTVSFEGFDKKTYENSRVGANFEKVVANVERLRRIRERSGSGKPKIRVQAVLAPAIEKNIDKFISFWKDRVDQVSYNEMLDNVPGKIKTVRSPWICPFPYQRMTIMWDGSITFCYNDNYGKLIVGNVKKMSLKEAWKSSFNKLRRLHSNGRAHEIEACNECPLRNNEIRKLSSGPKR